MHKIIWIVLLSILAEPLLAQQEIGDHDINYTVAEQPWADSLGNHRIVLDIQGTGPMARAKLMWRRRDTDIGHRGIIITNAKGEIIPNIYRLKADREFADLVFGPVLQKGKYFLYYLPYAGKKNMGWWDGEYLNKESSRWTADSIKGKRFLTANVVKIESRTGFDSFYPMEVCATTTERKALAVKHGQGFLVFPEDRQFPIRMNKDLPLRWIRKGPSGQFKGKAMKHEYYAFQIGVYAPVNGIDNLQVFCTNPAVTCFNSGGIDARGKPFKKKLPVTQGCVQALWFGVDIPANYNEKQFKCTIQLKDGNTIRDIAVVLDIENAVLADRGDSEPWRHSRLRWLNSTLGIDSQVVAPYTALTRMGNTIKGKTTTLQLDQLGMPVTLLAGVHPLLQQRMAFILETASGQLHFQSDNLQFTKENPGDIQWVSSSTAGGMTMQLQGKMEADGSLLYQLQLKAGKNMQLKDIRLDIPMNRSAADYFMGMGRPGGYCPDAYEWKWKGPQDAFWIGAVEGGLHCELQGADYTGPLLNLYHPAPPSSWFNNNKGGFRLFHKGDAVHCETYSGDRQLAAGDSLVFSFKILVTPVKKTDPADQFTNRYFHDGGHPDPKPEDLASGIRIVNLHHANPYNPYINYPFKTLDSLKYFVDKWHAKSLKVKLYYTIRELTNQLPELWALRSLGEEIFADGRGGGFPWLREHLADHYDVQWFTPIEGYAEPDVAIRTSGESRWYNYYIEGLRWLVQHADIDGLYLDDVSFDRGLLQRMRKVMDAVKPGCLLDLHSNTGFSKGPATQYTEFFPYINKLWFGESFQYDKMPPDNWLVEVSGIPFGLMGDMLQGGGHPWRGMVYGMTVRYPWRTEGVYCDPRDIWKVWDSFGISEATMRGYWEKDCPVTLSEPDLKATVYCRKDALLLAIGSWAGQDKTTTIQINWKALGIAPTSKKIYQPAILNFQSEAIYELNEAVKIPQGKGVLLEIR